jgi:hypothetical protein
LIGWDFVFYAQVALPAKLNPAKCGERERRGHFAGKGTAKADKRFAFQENGRIISIKGQLWNYAVPSRCPDAAGQAC